jgi:hypothetical protein
MNDYRSRLPQWLQAIERRIGVATGQAPHPGEESINIHHHKMSNSIKIDQAHDELCLRGDSNAKKCGLAVSNVHHDKVSIIRVNHSCFVNHIFNNRKFQIDDILIAFDVFFCIGHGQF